MDDNKAPLLESIHTQNPQEKQDPEIKGTELDHTLVKLEAFLTFLGFNQPCSCNGLLSWIAFVLIGVLFPVLVLVFFKCSDCDKYQIEGFEIVIMGSQACLAAVSLLCLSHNLRKYDDIREFLIVDRDTGHIERYIEQIKGSFRLLLWWSLPCLLLKLIREVVRMLYVHHDSWWLSVSILFALVLSWAYVSTISLTASILFHLVCNLQVIHFEEYGRTLLREHDVSVFMMEHDRLRLYLSRISHRFRIFLLLQFLVVTASQFVTLFEVTGYSGKVTFINGSDFSVSTTVQVVGIIICLHAATRISHRAQALASFAAKWHAIATCSSDDSSHNRNTNGSTNLETAITINSLHLSYSESDLESCDYSVSMPKNTQLASYMSSYHSRQAFVTYLQANAGGITIFGWTVDRALLNTIFFIELSLITFVLGKTIVFSST